MMTSREGGPGAVAAGSPITVRAGLDALRAGGNAVDALVAASLMACVDAPRAHVEDGVLHVDSAGRPPGTMEALAAARPDMRRFDGPNMFFDGLHVAGITDNGFTGAGDARRSGCFERA